MIMVMLMAMMMPFVRTLRKRDEVSIHVLRFYGLGSNASQDPSFDYF